MIAVVDSLSPPTLPLGIAIFYHITAEFSTQFRMGMRVYIIVGNSDAHCG